MHPSRPRLPTLATAAAGLALVVACGSSNEGLPILDDPQAIVRAAAETTAALGTVHARIDIMASDGGADGVQILMEADIDVQGRAVAGRTQAAERGQANPEVSDFIAIGGRTFSRTGGPGDPRWVAHDNRADAAHLPTNAEYVAIIDRLVADGGVALDLADPVPCGDGECYHVRATCDPGATWLLLAAPITGEPSSVEVQPPPGQQPTAATLDLYIDQATRVLTGIDGSFALGGTSVTFSIVFSNHDVAIQIAPPPPNLVDDNTGGAPIGEPMPDPQP